MEVIQWGHENKISIFRGYKQFIDFTRYYDHQIIVFNHVKQPWSAHVLILIIILNPNPKLVVFMVVLRG